MIIKHILLMKYAIVSTDYGEFRVSNFGTVAVWCHDTWQEEKGYFPFTMTDSEISEIRESGINFLKNY